MLTFAEVPGLYVQPDTALVCAIDHIDAELIEHDKQKLRVRITNPTKFTARVKVLCENSENMSEPLKPMALLDCPVLELAPNDSIEKEFPLGVDSPIS